jgi:hypothetical protein
MTSLRRYVAATVVLVCVAGACSSQATATGSTAPTRTARSTATLAPTPTTGSTVLGGPVAVGGDLCGLLGPGDFASVGVVGAVMPTKNSDDASDAYCVYSGVSGATGGIEFDVYLGDAAATYQEILLNGGITTNDAVGDLPGVTAAGTTMDGAGDMATIGVQKGQLTFDIDIPTSASARAELISLAVLVLQRERGLSS